MKRKILIIITGNIAVGGCLYLEAFQLSKNTNLVKKRYNNTHRSLHKDFGRAKYLQRRPVDTEKWNMCKESSVLSLSYP